MEIQRDQEVAVIILRAGRANAMDEAFLNGILRLFDEVESSGARAAVLTGYDVYFSAGLALPSLLGLPREQMGPFMGLFDKVMRRVFAFPLPVVAAVNGHAIAGGCVLSLQCDLRLMADAPVKIGLNEVQNGLGLPASALEALRFHVLSSSLVSVALEGSLFSPSEAKRVGLVDEVLPSSDLLGKSIARARSLARGGPEAVAQIKRALRRPFLERIEREGVEQRERWLDTWFSPAAQDRLAEAVARITAKR
jgi:enoyl-CoA hydratase